MSKFLTNFLPPKLVSCELGPNYTWKDLTTWWYRSSHIEQTLKSHVDLGLEYYWVDSGRTGLALLLTSLGLSGDVMIQAYSCVVVPNSVLQAGMTPIVIDVEKDGYNIDLKQVEERITEQTKVLIIQHTYGIPVDMDKVMKIVSNHNLILIEDMAHALGNSWNGKLLGSYGHGAVYSFGRDKVVSCGTGGLIVINRTVENNLNQLYSELKPMNFWRVFQQIYYMYITVLFVRPLYHWQLGKVILKVSQMLKLIDGVFTTEEMVGTKKLQKSSTLPLFLKKILSGQFLRLTETRKHRLELQKIYGSLYDQPLIRYPFQTNDSDYIKRKARKKGYILGTWYQKLFIPRNDILNKLTLDTRSLKNANYLLKAKILNLPTNTNCSISDAQKLIDIIK
jgi:perosamine synthetase